MSYKYEFRTHVADEYAGDLAGKMILTATIGVGPDGHETTDSMVLDDPADVAYFSSLESRVDAHIADPTATPLNPSETPEDRVYKIKRAKADNAELAAKKLREKQTETMKKASKA